MISQYYLIGKREETFLYYCCAVLLCLSLIREVLGFQVYFNSVIPVIFSIFIMFFGKKYINPSIIFPIFIFLIATLIQFAHPSLLDFIYLIKISTLFLTTFLILNFLKRETHLAFFVYLTLFISIFLTLIEFFTIGFQSRTLFLDSQVVRLHGIFGHHNYSGIIYILIASICLKKRLLVPMIIFVTLALLTGSKGVYLYILAGFLCFLFKTRFVNYFVFILFWISWLLPFWFPIFLQLIPDPFYDFIAIFSNFRSVHWEVYSDIAQSNLLYGTGYVNSLNLYSVYANHAIDNFSNIQIQHNLSLEVLTGYGIFFWMLFGLIISRFIILSQTRFQIFFVSMIFLPYVFYNGLTFIGLWFAVALLLNELQLHKLDSNEYKAIKKF